MKQSTIDTERRASTNRIGRRHLILALAALLASPLLAFPGDAARRAKKSDKPPTGIELVTQWDSRLEAIDGLLEAGKWDRGRREARALAKEMIDHCATFASSARPVAAMAGYRALAESGLGSRDDAVWYWRLARNLDPGIIRWDLERFGAPGRFLREVNLRQPGEIPLHVPFDPRAQLRTTAPEVKGDRLVRGRSGCRGLRLSGSSLPKEIAIEVVVTADGRAIEPVLETRVRFPIYLYQMFEQIRDLRFEPARFEGRPVPVVYPVIIKSKHTTW